jgi:hypothetical protein
MARDSVVFDCGGGGIQRSGVRPRLNPGHFLHHHRSPDRFHLEHFAILGLRALYFLVSGLVQMFAYLKYGVALILGFVGVKMLIVHWVHISTVVSLGVVVGVLSASVALSVILAPRENKTHRL